MALWIEALTKEGVPYNVFRKGGRGGHGRSWGGGVERRRQKWGW